MNELPSGWVETTLGDICLPVTSHRPADRPGEEFTYIDIGGIEAQRITETKRLLGSEAPSRARQLVTAGDTILSTVRTYLKKTALVPDEFDGATASTGFCVLRPASGIEPRFVFYRAIEERFVSDLSARQTGSSYPAVRDTDVFQSGIRIPPTIEQRRIVAAIEEQLSRLDAAESSLLRTLERLALARQALLRRAFEDHDWPVVAWSDVGTSQNGRAFPSKDYAPEGVHLLRPGNLHASGAVVWNESNTRRLPEWYAEAYPRYLVGPGELVMNLTAQSLKDDFLGRVCITPPAEHCLLNQRLARLRVGPEVEPRFLLWLFQSPVFRRFVASLNTGSLIQHMFTRQLDEFRFGIPPLDEQRRIVAEVERQLSILDATKAAIDRALERSKALRRAILERAFTGRLVPQDPSDEPASVLLERIRAERATATPHRRAPSPRKTPRQLSLQDVVSEATGE